MNANETMFSKTLIYDACGDHVYLGSYSPTDTATAHQQMLDDLDPRNTFRNVAQVYGCNGTVEMNSGTLNIHFEFTDLRSRPEFIVPVVLCLKREAYTVFK